MQCQECEGAECPVYSPDIKCLKTYDFVVYKEEDTENNDKLNHSFITGK